MIERDAISNEISIILTTATFALPSRPEEAGWTEARRSPHRLESHPHQLNPTT